MIILPDGFIAPVGHTLLHSNTKLPHSFLLFKKSNILIFPKSPNPAPKGHKYLQKNLSINKQIINKKACPNNCRSRSHKP